ncbi:MAG: hypothetical protein LBF00_03090 [Mycoplasmataceae bacterium]|jgi:hypothetical protein|nr:hypothetical protein [Mycoplasmataceae bacterium]
MKHKIYTDKIYKATKQELLDEIASCKKEGYVTWFLEMLLEAKLRNE